MKTTIKRVAMHVGFAASKVASLLRPGLVIASVALGAVAAVPEIARADEGGVSFWIPGLYGSLAAVPGTPGWSVTEIYYHDSVSASADVARARVIELGRIRIGSKARAESAGSADEISHC